MVTHVLTDIEGTTTPIAFVHDVLFPYSRDHLAEYVGQHGRDPVVRDCLKQADAKSDDEAVEVLLGWIADDRKHPALKTLQGLIWRHGYESGKFRSDLYPDVEPALKKWKARGLTLGVYSSGSVAAQKLLFGYTEHGDLTQLFSHYFDTEVGGKKEAGAYREILRRLAVSGEKVLFLSDVTAELDAAREAGMKTTQLARPGTVAGKDHPVAKDFASLPF